MDSNRRTPRTSLACLAAMLLAPCLAGAQVRIHFQSVSRSIIESRLDSFSKRDPARERQIKELFLQAGCDPQHLSEHKVGGALPNVICIAPGRTPEEIIVGAHYDHVVAGDGVVDNWSGASLLPSLLQSLAGLQRDHTFVFIAFSGEEEGLLGSHSYVTHMSAEDRGLAQAMVNLDTLGLGPSEVWVSHSNPGLVNALVEIARTLQLPLSGMNVDQVGTTDSQSFARKKIPTITIHSLTSSNLRILHSPLDTITAIKLDDYYNSYKLVAAYLAFLDAELGTSSPPAPASGSH